MSFDVFNYTIIKGNMTPTCSFMLSVKCYCLELRRLLALLLSIVEHDLCSVFFGGFGDKRKLYYGANDLNLFL